MQGCKLITFAKMKCTIKKFFDVFINISVKSNFCTALVNFLYFIKHYSGTLILNFRFPLNLIYLFTIWAGSDLELKGKQTEDWNHEGTKEDMEERDVFMGWNIL